jgi:small subunit ribosomal protein S11
MGKKRIIKAAGEEGATQAKTSSRGAKRRIEHGTLYVNSTYNNTSLLLADEKGNTAMWSSSGSLGFKGAKKGTPFAAGKVAEQLAEKAIAAGLKEIDIVVKGVGSGRESSIRSFISKGVAIASIKDETPVPFNGPKPKKPRRV